MAAVQQEASLLNAISRMPVHSRMLSQGQEADGDSDYQRSGAGQPLETEEIRRRSKMGVVPSVPQLQQ